MTIIWCMVPEIWNATDKIFWQLGRHSLLFYLPSNPENQNLKKIKKKNAWRYHPFTQVYQKSRSHLCYSWDMACDGCNFFIFHFVLFFTLTSWKIKSFKKMKKTPGDIIILHICTKNYDHMMYGSWDMVRDGWKEIVTLRGGCPT